MLDNDVAGYTGQLAVRVEATRAALTATDRAYTLIEIRSVLLLVSFSGTLAARFSSCHNYPFAYAITIA
jgi:hypothetical protein